MKLNLDLPTRDHVVVVTDKRVGALYAADLIAELEQQFPKVNLLTIAGDEACKNQHTKADLERQLQNETNRSMIIFIRNDLDAERSRRLEQDVRNQVAFSRAVSLRSEYIAENRKNWGSKLRIIIRSRDESVPLRDIVKALAKYAELLPREPVTK